jgi:hypothetical protein
MKHFGMVVFLIAILYAFPGPPSKGQPTATADPLKCEVKSFHIENGSIIDALKLLKNDARRVSVIFTLEVVAYRERPPKNLTISLDGTTIKDVLDQIVKHDPRYIYQKIDSHLIHVLPVSALHDHRDLLSITIKNFKIAGVPYDAFLKNPPNFIPDLQGEIMLRSKSGGYIGGGLLASGVPTINLTVQNITVRQLLNRIAEETLKLPRSEFAPIGWIYTLRLDNSLAMGGEPKWDIF